MLGFQLTQPLHLFLFPNACAQDGRVEFHHEMENVFLVSVIAPHMGTSRKLVAEALDAAIRDLANIHIHQFVAVFAGDVQVNHHASVLVLREGEAHQRGTFRSGHLSPYLSVGKEDAIVAQWRLFRGFVDT